jgi:Ca2+-binding EF-hand superfamily protein
LAFLALSFVHFAFPRRQPMPRTFLSLLTVVVLLACSAHADDKEKKDKDAPKPVTATIVKVDAKKGEITVKLTDDKGKETEKTFKLSDDVRYLDETGRVVKLDVFQAGHDALIVESDGKLRELRRTVRAHEGRRLSDAVKVLIEMSDCEDGCTEEVQRIYDMLRQLDTGKNGKIDPVALKAASEKILEERVDGLIKRLDTNNDGKISKEEAKGLLKEHFEKIDTNKDGFIDRDELLKAAREKRDNKTPDKEKK